MKTCTFKVPLHMHILSVKSAWEIIALSVSLSQEQCWIGGYHIVYKNMLTYGYINFLLLTSIPLEFAIRKFLSCKHISQPLQCLNYAETCQHAYIHNVLVKSIQDN